jgi:putative membrane protein
MPDPFLIDDDRGTDLSARRTGLAFQRTRMAADRTVMAVIRTSLSLISFGFTIYKVIEGIQEGEGGPIHDQAARNIGVTLILIGIVTLIGGIVYQLRFMNQLRAQRVALEGQGSIHAESPFPFSFNLVLAVLLLLVGIFAILSILFRLGPFI